MEKSIYKQRKKETMNDRKIAERKRKHDRKNRKNSKEKKITKFLRLNNAK